jgi:hypothetical protein
MVQEISGILAVGLLTVNVGMSAFLLVKDTGGLAGNAIVVVPLVTGLILGSVWALAYVWHFHGRMHMAKQRALATLNPYMTTDFTPHEWVLWNYITLPQLRAQAEMMARLGLDTKEIEATVARLERWLAAGKVPKGDFPPMLERFLRASP